MDSSSPSTCLSLSSSDLFASPSNSSLASWPSSPSSSKRTAAAAARFSSSPSKRRHGGQLDHQDIDCTLSLGNAATRKSEDAPSRLSRAGSPVEDRGGGGHGSGGGGAQQFHWFRAQHPNLQCDLAAEAATRNLASLRRLQQVDAAAQPSSYQSILAAQNSHFPPYIPCTSATKLGGLLDFSATHHCSSSSSTLSGFLDLNAKFTSVDSCGTRSRFRGGGDGQHNDPRNVPRICAHCGTTSTPLWRNGPLGPKSLCNACGIRFKKVGRRSPTTTAATTTPVSSWSMQVPASAAFHQDTFGIRSSSSEGIPPPMASPLLVQRDKRNCIPFAREWSDSTSSSNYAFGSSCITWQDSSSSLPSSLDSASNIRRVVSSSSRRLSSPPAAVLEAEVIRSSDDRRRVEQGSFLKIAL